MRGTAEADSYVGERTARRSGHGFVTWRALAGLLMLVLNGCAGVLTPRFGQDIQTAVSRADMQRIETEKLILYYPKGTREEALRVASRLEYCRGELEKLTPFQNGPAARKSMFVLPELPFNNAYVAPPIAGGEQVAVLPQYNTASLFLYLGILPDPGTIGCHEMVHDMTFRQMSRVAKGLHYAFGRGSFSPQIGLDSWFHEGIAVYYETKLQGVGRLWTKYFEGVFASGIQDERINGGFLNRSHREPLFGGNYLFGSHFIDYLARTYGEEKIWEVVRRQSRALASPLGVGVRFKRVYGKSLSDLLDEFNTYAHERFPTRQRPQTQERIRQFGTMAVMARSLDGHVATVSQDLDQPLRIYVHAPDGTELVSRRLTDVGFFGRRIVASGALLVSGLSLTADGRHAYFVALDNGPVYSEARLVHLDVAKNRLRVIAKDVGGAGGSISPDGTKYYFSRPNGDSFSLHVYDLAKHAWRPLTQARPREYQAHPFISPDGKRLVVLEASEGLMHPVIYDATSGERIAEVVTPEGATLQPSWRDDDHLVYLASDGVRMQVFESELSTARYRRLTDAPYLAGAPFADGKNVYFLNREGWKWTFDQASYAAAEPWQQASTRAVGAAAQHRLEPLEVSRHKANVSLSDRTLLAFLQDPPTDGAPTDVAPAPPGSEAPADSLADAPVTAPIPVEEEAAPQPTTPAGQGSAATPATEAATPGALQSAASTPTAAPSLLTAPGLSGLKQESTSHAYWVHQTPQDRTPHVTSDEEDYSAFDGLLLPQTWAPSGVARGGGLFSVGAAAIGGDRLGLQRWLISAAFDTESELPSASFNYINAMGAPYQVSASAAFIGRNEKQIEGFDPEPGDVQIQEVVGNLTLSRSWYNSHTLGVGANYTSARYEEIDGGALVDTQRFVGPTVSFVHVSGESTPYSGTRVGFGLGTSASYYPELLGNANFDLVDTRIGASVTTPLPLSRRHTLRFGGRIRALLGPSEDVNLLQVGGGGNSTLPISLDNTGPGMQSVLPANLRFFEPLRGFEDVTILAQRALIGTAEYRYPIIVDWGTASTFRFLPAFFLRQFDLELFFSSATFLEDHRQAALAAGAALEIEIQLWQLPLSLIFQETRRLSYDEDFAFYFGFGVPL